MSLAQAIGFLFPPEYLVAGLGMGYLIAALLGVRKDALTERQVSYLLQEPTWSRLTAGASNLDRRDGGLSFRARGRLSGDIVPSDITDVLVSFDDQVFGAVALAGRERGQRLVWTRAEDPLFLVRREPTGPVIAEEVTGMALLWPSSTPERVAEHLRRHGWRVHPAPPAWMVERRGCSRMLGWVSAGALVWSPTPGEWRWTRQRIVVSVVALGAVVVAAAAADLPAWVVPVAVACSALGATSALFMNDSRFDAFVAGALAVYLGWPAGVASAVIAAWPLIAPVLVPNPRPEDRLPSGPRH